MAKKLFGINSKQLLKFMPIFGSFYAYLWNKRMGCLSPFMPIFLYNSNKFSIFAFSCFKFNLLTN